MDFRFLCCLATTHDLWREGRRHNAAGEDGARGALFEPVALSDISTSGSFPDLFDLFFRQRDSAQIIL